MMFHHQMLLVKLCVFMEENAYTFMLINLHVTEIQMDQWLKQKAKYIIESQNLIEEKLGNRTEIIGILPQY